MFQWWWILIVVALVFLFLVPKKRIKVYGSKNCGWTLKQLDYLGSRAEFIDCEKTKCPSWVTGYPGVEMTNGKQFVGFQQV